MRTTTAMALGAASWLLAACGGGGESSTTSSTPPPSGGGTNSPAVQAFAQELQARGIKLTRELGERRALRIQSAGSAERITVSGARNASGGLVGVESVQIEGTAQAATVHYLNEHDRRIEVGATHVTLQQQADGRWTIEFVDQSSGTSLRTNLDGPAAPAGVRGLPRRSAQAARAATVAAAGPRPVGPSSVQVPGRSPSAAHQIPVQIRTTSCGTPADMPGPVRLSLSGPGGWVASYAATRVGPGDYIAYIPDSARESEVSLDTIKDALDSAAEVMSYACQFDSASPMLAPTACTMVAAAIAGSSLGAGTPLAVQFLSACEVAVLAARASCRVLDRVNLPVPEYVDPVAAELLPTLQDILIDMVPQTLLNHTVTPYVDAIPSDITGASVAVAAGATSLSTAIDDANPRIVDLVLNPAAPAAGVDYTAAATLRCLPFGSSARLQIVGTDGYDDETSNTYPQNTAQTTLTLQVPGAESGVRDTVTLTVTPRTGGVMTRTAHLVFQ